MILDYIEDFIRRFFGTRTLKVSGRWVMTNCPFSRRTHLDKDDKRFSFGISNSLHFHCFTCGAKGHLSRFPFLLSKLGLISDGVKFEMIEYIERLKEYRGVLSYDEIVRERVKCDDGWYEFFKGCPLANESEVRSLFLIKEDVEKWEIRYWVQEKALLFPLYDEGKNCIGVKVRKDVGGRRVFYYLGSSGTGKLWYGSHFPLKKDKPLFLVEGERDAILLSRYVTNVWASLGPPTIEMIKRLPKDMVLVLFFDNDLGGQKIREKVLKHIQGAKKIYVIDDYGFKDPAEVIENNRLEEVIKKHYRRISL